MTSQTGSYEILHLHLPSLNRADTNSIRQETWFSPKVLLIIIDDLNAIMALFKFVNDVTLTELIDQSNISRMQGAADQIADWSHRNFMNINTKKTKQMLFGRITENTSPQVAFNTGADDRVTSFKLLGVIISGNLSWENYVNAVCAKAETTEAFISDIRWHATLLKFIKRPVIEYTYPVWQSGLTTDRCGRLDWFNR